MAVWFLTIDLSDLVGGYRAGKYGVPELAEKVVGHIRSSGWRDITPYPDTFDALLDDLKEATNCGEYDVAFAEIYDLADSDRIWIETA